MLEAADWYSARSSATADRFATEVSSVVTRIGNDPLHFPTVFKDVRRDAVGEPAEREEIDAGGGDGGRGRRRDPARGFGDRTAARHRHRLAELRQAHIVEQHRVDTDGKRFGELGERVDLDLDLDEM